MNCYTISPIFNNYQHVNNLASSYTPMQRIVLKKITDILFHL